MVRKLSRKGETCGSDEMVSGGVANPLGDQNDDMECGAELMVSGGIADPLGPGKGGAEAASECLSELQGAATKIITALHKAKEELAGEMEANLKQLKAVLKETQKIAREMEAVLEEAKCEPNMTEFARGVKEEVKDEGWQPPAFAEKSCEASRKQNGEADAEEAPAWEPPGEQQQMH